MRLESADGVGRAVEVVLGHQGVVPEAGEGGRQPVVPVLSGQDRPEHRVVHVGGDDLSGGPPGVAEEPVAHDASEQGSHPGRHGPGREVRAGGSRTGLHLGEVAPDAVPLGREARGQPVDEAFLAGGEVEGPASDHDPVVHLGQRLPAELTHGDIVEEGANGSTPSRDLAHVVDADVPLEAVPLEGMGESSGRVVALEHQHPEPAAPRQHGRHPEAADAGAHHHRVEGTLDGLLLPGRADAPCQGRLPPASRLFKVGRARGPFSTVRARDTPRGMPFPGAAHPRGACGSRSRARRGRGSWVTRRACLANPKSVVMQ